MMRLYKPRFCKYRSKQMGRFYKYKPRGNLIDRLATELNMKPDRVLAEIQRERVKILRERYPSERFQDWEVL